MSEQNRSTPWIQAVGAKIKHEPVKAFESAPWRDL